MRMRILPLLLALTLLCACAAPAPAQTPSAPADETSPVTPAAEESDAPPEEAAQQLALAWTPAEGLDPYACENGTNRALLPLLYEGLYTVRQDFTASHTLCASETVSDDGLVWTLLLREAQFSDGSAVTAADVISSLEAARAGQYAERLSCIVNAEAVNTRQVKLTLDAPREQLPLLLDFPITQGGKLGSGAYVLAGTKLARNPYFSGACALTAAEITLVPLSKATEIRDAFEQERLSAVVTDPNAASAVSFHTDYELWTWPTATMQYIGFNLNSELFSDTALRCAVGRAIDRQTLVHDTMGGFGTAAVLPAPPQSGFYDGGLAADYEYSAQEARDFLRRAGEHESFACTMIVSSANSQRVLAAQQAAQMLNAVGFEVTVSPLRHEDFLAALRNGSYDLCYCEIALSADADLMPLFSGSLPGLPQNESVQLLCTQARENSGNCYTLHKAIADQGLLCPVAFKSEAVYAARGVLGRLTPSVGSAFWQEIEEAP